MQKRGALSVPTNIKTNCNSILEEAEYVCLAEPHTLVLDMAAVFDIPILDVLASSSVLMMATNIRMKYKPFPPHLVQDTDRNLIVTNKEALCAGTYTKTSCESILEQIKTIYVLFFSPPPKQASFLDNTATPISSATILLWTALLAIAVLLVPTEISL